MKVICLTPIFAIFLLFNTDGLINGQIKIDGYSINPKIAILSRNLPKLQCYGGEISILNRHFLYTLDYYYGWDRAFEDGGGVILAKYFYDYQQLDFLIGKYIGDRFLRFQYQGGLGTFWGYKQIVDASLNATNFFTLGIPVKLGFKILPTKFISLGIDLQANFNVEKTYGMALVSIEIGKLRNKIVK